MTIPEGIRWLAILWALAPRCVVAQSATEVREAVLSGFSTASMRYNLEVLSGERSFHISEGIETAEDGWIEDTSWTITTRASSTNDIPAYFIRSTLEEYGIEAHYDIQADERYIGGAEARNVLGILRGTTEPDTKIYIGAHYDAVHGSPGADDNGSGTVAVLEIARLLAAYRPARTIVFAFWDAEEQGLVGSRLHAEKAAMAGKNIMAVLNLDMVGWNRDEPTMLIAPYPPYAGEWLAGYTLSMMSALGLSVEPVSYGFGRSDHVGFASQGFEAILLIEDYGADFNPYYHSSNDRIEHIDFAYLTELAKTAAASLVGMAFDTNVHVGVEPPARGLLVGAVQAYPNPARAVVQWSGVDAADEVELFDLLGRRVATGSAGSMDVTGLPRGVYVYRVAGSRGTVVLAQ